ncbi:alpha/beta hydrolase [Sphingobium amiense]|uniref:Alpha/beta hydrolase n=2 Tax=Sphingobium amiense TaxID=135719 RepID=A0A494W2F5_9SPHN|nr:alpha/beta hydrolase [Sphingobium amiense]
MQDFQPFPTDALGHVDPALRNAAREIWALMTRDDVNLSMLRAGRSVPDRQWRDDVPVSRKLIPGAPGDPDIPIHIINARPGLSCPGILHMHGGGFVTGAAHHDVAMLQDMARSLDAVIVSVDYRLAPEVRYIGSVEDNYCGLAWMHAHTDELGVDRARIAIAGESAGGGHAALLAIAARGRGEYPILFQSLVYPMLDDRTGSSRAVPPHVGTLIWTPQCNRLGWEALLGEPPGTDSVLRAGVPARTADLAGLPPAWIGVGAVDLFVDEDIDYARRLIDAAVPTELLVVPGAFHGFDLLVPDSPPARQLQQARLNALRRAFIPA